MSIIKRSVDTLANARKEIFLKLEELLEKNEKLKLYPKRLDNSYIDVISKGGEILAVANSNYEKLFNMVDFDRVYETKADQYKANFKRLYDNCHEAIRSNGNVSLNTTVVGMIGPLVSPNITSNGYLTYHELSFSTRELKELDSEYFTNLENYEGDYIIINDLAKLMFNIHNDEGETEGKGDNGVMGTRKIDDDIDQQAYSRNKILFGPPGTGKSYNIGEKLNLINVKEENITRVTFHPEYSYYEFIGQYKPVVAYERIAGNNIRYPSRAEPSNEKAFVYYDFVAGPFTKAIINALKLKEENKGEAAENALLIIEEINRGNSSAIFGDIFQLLDRINDVNNEYYGESEYPINISIEMKEYIKKELNWGEEDWKRKFERGFVIPSNLYIYSTMNTSDQSLYPMDSAFKRRWDMEYIYINYKEEKLKDLYLPQPYEDIKWLDFIKKINQEIVDYTGVDDKQIGQWFMGKGLLESEFQGKLISYLWFDIFRHDPQIIFKDDIKTFDDIRSFYNKGVFREEIIDGIKGEEEIIDHGVDSYEES